MTIISQVLKTWQKFKKIAKIHPKIFLDRREFFKFETNGMFQLSSGGDDVRRGIEANRDSSSFGAL